MGSYESGVYISYAWGDEREEIVDELDRSLQQRGIKIIRDKHVLGYKGSIREFMEQIGRGYCVIVVVSDKYLRSPNCMFELVEIAENKQFQDRIFPIVLSDAAIYDPVKRVGYVKYWEDKKTELAAAIRSVNDPANLQGSYADLDDYDRYRDEISKLINTLKNMNVLTPDMHHDSDFSALCEALEKRLSLLKSSEEAAPGAGQSAGAAPGASQLTGSRLNVKIKLGTIDQEANVVGTALSDEALSAGIQSATEINADSVSGNLVGAVAGGQPQIGNQYHQENISVGNISNSSGVAIGHGIHQEVHISHGASAEEIAKAFSTLMEAIQSKPAGPIKVVAETAVKGLEAEAAKGAEASEDNVQQWFTTLAQMAPDILEVAVNTFINPISGLSTVFKKVAERIKKDK